MHARAPYDKHAAGRRASVARQEDLAKQRVELCDLRELGWVVPREQLELPALLLGVPLQCRYSMKRCMRLCVCTRRRVQTDK